MKPLITPHFGTSCRQATKSPTYSRRCLLILLAAAFPFLQVFHVTNAMCETGCVRAAHARLNVHISLFIAAESMLNARCVLASFHHMSPFASAYPISTSSPSKLHVNTQWGL